MKVTVCDFPDEMRLKQTAWAELVAHVATARSDMVVLPEMPFCHWIFVGDAVDTRLWGEVPQTRDRMIHRLHELGTGWVMSSHPGERDGRRLNEHSSGLPIPGTGVSERPAAKHCGFTRATGVSRPLPPALLASAASSAVK